MRKIIILIILFPVFWGQLVNAQHDNSIINSANLQSALKTGETNVTTGGNSPFSKTLTENMSGSDTFLKTVFILSPLNPMLVVENKTVYFALTKEFSFVFPFVRTGKWGSLLRVGAEYSYVFRSEQNSHIRAFACVDLPIEAGDFAAIVISPGAGYFTDTRKNGVFPQLSAGILAPFSDVFAANLYAKLRYSFMLKAEESNVFDASLGIGISVYLF